ncbi:MAG: hypothetical protein COX79_03270 [Candidatus Levybacteria bacterium CG_4_10_14_0_2_um_filter_36_16]|nr:MAG: hypothetical protein AUK12_05240 [Candidatus Levybacteria bacterium CG2_30_37_29]PIR79453.1 MAG: hypothetical protein COU26_01115 [Candidatus Levybacteria bacterium CG10_big_fil_rev_8_21_14_0_10_36_30]PIZ97182.1 MAG: hypothetical protein COX79_03270 [Candidatus Levybacteria bacterium CG_4_10_14_0_2_um_filter_36_16]
MQALESVRRVVLDQWEFGRLPDVPEFSLSKGCKLVHFRDESELNFFAEAGLKVVDLKTPKAIIGSETSMRAITRVFMALVYDSESIEVVTKTISRHDNPFDEARKLREDGYRIVNSSPSMVVSWKEKDPENIT